MPGRMAPTSQTCVYCGEPTGTEFDEHEECVERSLEQALDDETDDQSPAGAISFAIAPAAGLCSTARHDSMLLNRWRCSSGGRLK